MEKCRVCLLPAPVRCKECQEVYYCGRACQTSHWAAHKTECKLLQDVKAASQEGALEEDAEGVTRMERAMRAAAALGGKEYAALHASWVGASPAADSAPAHDATVLQAQLSAAAGEGNVAEIGRLLSAGAKLEGPAAFGQPPLHAAASAGQVGALAALIAAGAPLDTRDRHGLTALHLAVMQGPSAGHVACVRTLGEAGARFDGVVGASRRGGGGNEAAADDAMSGRTLLHLAAASDGSTAEEGADAGDAAMMRAVVQGCAGQLRAHALGLDGGALPLPLSPLPPSLVDSRDPDGLTALVYACAHANVECARILLSVGACVHGHIPPQLLAALVDRAAARQALAFADPSMQPLTIALECYAAAVGEEESAVGASLGEDSGIDDDVLDELRAAAGAAAHTQVRCLAIIRMLFAAGAVLTSAACVPSSAFEHLPWDEAGLPLPTTGAPLLLPPLAAAVSDRGLVAAVLACVNEGGADPVAKASDGRTTPLHVAALALNECAFAALRSACTVAMSEELRASLAACVLAGSAWASAQAAECEPAAATTLLAEAEAAAAAIREEIAALPPPQF